MYVNHPRESRKSGKSVRLVNLLCLWMCSGSHAAQVRRPTGFRYSSSMCKSLADANWASSGETPREADGIREKTQNLSKDNSSHTLTDRRKREKDTHTRTLHVSLGKLSEEQTESRHTTMYYLQCPVFNPK